MSVEYISEGDVATPAFMNEVLNEIAGGGLNVQSFGAVGDGVTDDTTAVHAAFDAMIANQGGSVVFPEGVYRVTSAYTTDAAYEHLRIIGEGRSHSGTAQNDQRGSRILLDNASATSFFVDVSGDRNRLTVRDITFKCAQEVQDRDFFRFTSVLHQFDFENVNFDAVERPLVFKDGSYFQSSSLRNVQFWASGTIHSETNNLVGTLLVLDNVNHEDVVPANTAKIVCDLSGIREIQGRNFLLEGETLPSTGWTVLKIDNSQQNVPWVTAPTAAFRGFWSEWGANKPDYVVDQVSGRVLFSECRLHLSSANQYKLSSRAQTVFDQMSLANESASDVAELFDIEDFRCHVTMRHCAVRDFRTPASGVAQLHNDQFTFENCTVARSADAADETLGSTVFSNAAPTLVYKWDGGYLDGDPATLSLFGGTTSQLDTDATYGRQLTIIPNANTINFFVEAKLRGVLAQYQQVVLVMKMKMPTYTGGIFFLRMIEDGTGVTTWAEYSFDEFSATEVDVFLPYRMKNAVSSEIGVQISGSGSSPPSGVSGNLEIYSLALYAGNAAPRKEYPSYPRNVVTWAAAMPSAGSFVRGDVVYNNAPALDASDMSVLGWRRLVTGSAHVSGTDWAIMNVSHVSPAT